MSLASGILVFQSSAFVIDWSESAAPESEPPLGGDLAEWARAWLKSQGVSESVPEPFAADEGWLVESDWGGARLSLFFNWARLGKERTDFWVLQARYIPPFLERMRRGAKRRQPELDALLDRLASAIPGVRNCKRASSQELEDLYRLVATAGPMGHRLKSS